MADNTNLMNNYKRPDHTGGIAARTAYLGLFMALAILMGYVEAIIPIQMPTPGMKLGLPNLVIVCILYLYSWREAVVISALRVVVIGFLFGNMFSIAYGLPGAVLSLLVMTCLKKTRLFSVIGISAAGGVIHNISQAMVAFFIVRGFPILWYLPILMLAGLFAGTLIGLASSIIIPRIYPESRRHL